MSTAPVSTHSDWTSPNVDLMTIDELAKHFGVPFCFLAISVAEDRSFPRHRIGDNGIARWRGPDVDEWLEGQIKKTPGDKPGHDRLLGRLYE
jgi:hypothetical protein